MLTEGTDVSGARILLRTVLFTRKCRKCGEIYRWDMHTVKDPFCPKCGSEEYEVVTGYEIILKNIEISEEEGT